MCPIGGKFQYTLMEGAHGCSLYPTYNVLLLTPPGYYRLSHTFPPLFKVYGTSLLRPYANSPTAYGRQLLDTLFTREELKVSLLIALIKQE